MPKKHVVMARTPEIMKDGIPTSQGHLHFGGKATALVDASIANEIESEQGLKGTGEVWTHEDPRGNWMDRFKTLSGHKYFFGGHVSRRFRNNYRKIFGHD